MSRDRLIVRRLPGDLDTPVGSLLRLAPEGAGRFLFESIHGGDQLGRYSFIGMKPLEWLRIRGGRAERSARAHFRDCTALDLPPWEALQKFEELARADANEALPPMASGAFGYVSYDMIAHAEPVPLRGEAAPSQHDALLTIPGLVVVFDHLRQELILVARARGSEEGRRDAEAMLDHAEATLADRPVPRGKGRGEAAELDFQSNTTEARYHAMVRRAQELIRAGDIFQVVPSQRFSARYERPPVDLYRALRRLNPSPFMFLMDFGPLQLVGSSPEILVRVRDGRVAIRPIAGTRPRSGEPAEDARRAASLLADEKERAEHLMLLDLGRNDVGRVAAYGSVEVTEAFQVEQYSHVMHIVSQVEGELRDGLSCTDALRAGFPAGTVSGAPKIRAMQIISELEDARRGVYGGAVGYFGWDGDMDMCIALRTGVIEGGQLHIQAGGGVVLDSEPDYEYRETLAKAGAMMTAARESFRYGGQ